MQTKLDNGTRDKILKGILYSLEKHGYHKTTMKIIARQGKISQGVIHYHFPNKLILFITLFQQTANYWVNEIRKTNHDENSITRIIDRFTGKGEPGDRERIICWLCAAQEAIYNETIQKEYCAANKKIMKEIAEFIHYTDTRPRLDVRVLAVWSAIQGLWQIIAADPELPLLNSGRFLTVRNILIARMLEWESKKI